jgi:hypothetical protein
MIAGANLVFCLVQSVNVKIQNVHNFEELAFDQALSDGLFVNEEGQVVGVHLVFDHFVWLVIFVLFIEGLFLFLFSFNSRQNSIQKYHIEVDDNVLIKFKYFFFELFEDEVVGRETIFLDEFQNVVRQVRQDERA